jgi:hypothetical protein
MGEIDSGGVAEVMDAVDARHAKMQRWALGWLMPNNCACTA